MRMPWLLAGLLPVALAVASALLVSRLAAEGSLVGMRASGISDARIVLPALLVCALLTPVPLLLRSSGGSGDWEASAGSPGPDAKREWRRAGPWLVEAAAFDRRGATAVGMTLYRLDDEGLPARRVDAWRGRHLGGGVWQLADPSESDVGAAPSMLPLAEAAWSGVAARGLGTGALIDTISALEEAGLDARLQRAALHARLAETLACVALPALALFLSIDPRFRESGRGRRRGRWADAWIGGAIGAFWLLLVAISARAAGAAPATSGWAPLLVLSSLAGFTAWHALRRSR
jgi:lipopolysaccharide export LptBFGC system permease protein LptF